MMSQAPASLQSWLARSSSLRVIKTPAGMRTPCQPHLQGSSNSDTRGREWAKDNPICRVHCKTARAMSGALRHHHQPVCARTHRLLGCTLSNLPFNAQQTRSIAVGSQSEIMSASRQESQALSCNPCSIVEPAGLSKHAEAAELLKLDVGNQKKGNPGCCLLAWPTQLCSQYAFVLYLYIANVKTGPCKDMLLPQGCARGYCQ